MTNLPALPSSQRPTLAQSAADTLTRSLGTSLTVHQSISGDWILAPSNDLNSRALREAVAALDEGLAGGPTQQINAMILELIGATDRPPQLGDDEAIARVQALKQTAWDYPIEVVIQACRNWRKVPSKGRWWPTEQDIRAQCEPLFAPARSLRSKAMELLRNLEAEEEHVARSAKPSYFPGEKHRAFRKAMEARLLPDQMKAYFNPSHIRYVGENVVHVRTLIAEAIFQRYGSDVLTDLGMVLRCEPTDFLRERQLEQQMTPEEDAEVSAKMTRLNQAVKSGESIEKLRREGVL